VAVAHIVKQSAISFPEGRQRRSQPGPTAIMLLASTDNAFCAPIATNLQSDSLHCKHRESALTYARPHSSLANCQIRGTSVPIKDLWSDGTGTLLEVVNRPPLC
jgi:hypothetical protein